MICIVGGCGHVGLPLGIVLSKFQRVILFDNNQTNVDIVNNKSMPFFEDGAAQLLTNSINEKKIIATTNEKILSKCKTFIITIGTELDSFGNYKVEHFFRLFDLIKKNNKDQDLTFILRSTLFPGCCKTLIKYLNTKFKSFHFSYCPERILQGNSIKEISSLPQIISSMNEKSEKKAINIFKKICKQMIYLTFEEAEYVKLFCNAWRYSAFALSNQIFSSCLSHGINSKNVFHALKNNYPRTAGLPFPGFTAGPCLLKDTQTLGNYDNQNLSLFAESVNVNENMPKTLLDFYKNKQKINFYRKKILIIGLGFKKNSDDTRGSLTFKLIKLLRLEQASVYVYDPNIKNQDSFKFNFVSKNKVKDFSLVFMCNNDSDYFKLKFNMKVKIISPWLDWH